MRLNLSERLTVTTPDVWEAQKQHFLNTVLLVCCAACIAIGTGFFFQWQAGIVAATYPAFSLAAFPLLALAFWTGRKGKVNLAAWIPVIMVFLASALAGYQYGAGRALIPGFSIAGFSIAALAAGLLIGPVSGVLVALLSAATHIWVTNLLASDTIPGAVVQSDTLVLEGILVGTGLIVLVVFAWMINRAFQAARDREIQMRRDVSLARQELEKQVSRRTEDLQRRLAQIHTAAEISRSISSVLDPRVLLEQVVNQVKDGFSQYYVGVFLLDEQRQYAVLQAGTGEAGQRMLASGHRLAVAGESMIGQATSVGTARIAQDVGQERLRFNNPHLPWTRSELALPIQAGKLVLGAMTVQSEYIQAYDQDDILILQGIADSLAIAIENARLFSQSQASLAEIQALHRQYLAHAWSQVGKRPELSSYLYEQENFGRQPENVDGSMPVHPSRLDIPLLLRDQEVGRLLLEREDHLWTDDEQNLVAAVTAQAALALENARLLEDTQRQAAHDRLVAGVTHRVMASGNLDAMVQNALFELGRSLKASEGTIFLEIETEPARNRAEHGELIA